MMKIALYLIVALTLFGCSGSSKRLFFETGDNLEKEFGISDDKLEAFQEAPPTHDQVIVRPKKEKKKVDKKVTKKAAPKKKKVAPKKVVKKKFEYPENYPEEYIKYDKKSKELWKSFKPVFNSGEKYAFAVRYIGIPMGEVFIENMGQKELFKQDVIHFQVRLNSADFYSYIYKLDDVLDSYININTYVPVKYSLIQRETKQEVDDLQLFSQKELKTYIWYRRLKKSSKKLKKKQEEHFIPRYYQDTFSAFFFVRGLPIEVGKTIEFPVVARGKVWVLKLDAKKVETLEIMGKKVEAVKVKAETKFKGELKKRGDVVFWYSNDDQKRLLKFEAAIKIGNIKGELVKYNPGK